MDLELYSILAAVVLAASVLTVLLAVFAYIMFRLEEGRAMREAEKAPEPAVPAGKSQFFKPVEVSRAL